MGLIRTHNSFFKIHLHGDHFQEQSLSYLTTKHCVFIVEEFVSGESLSCKKVFGRYWRGQMRRSHIGKIIQNKKGEGGLCTVGVLQDQGCVWERKETGRVSLAGHSLSLTFEISRTASLSDWPETERQDCASSSASSTCFPGFTSANL